MQRRVNRESPSKAIRSSKMKSLFQQSSLSVLKILKRFPIVFPFCIGIWFGFIITNGSNHYNNVVLVWTGQTDRFVPTKNLPLAIDRIPASSQSLTKYLDEYQTKIDGWFSREILYVIWVVSRYQYDDLHLVGGIGEIGVHHGKFTCFLYLMRRYREQNLFAVDVFDNQALNKDGSGRGQKQTFLNSVRDYAGIQEKDLKLYAGSSLDLNPSFSTNQTAVQWWKSDLVGQRGLQLVSVDGGHTSLLTYSDLCLVSNWVVDGAVVAVDDITHPGWLGVRDGVGKFFTETSKLLTDFELENELAAKFNLTNFDLSRRVVEATTLPAYEQQRSPCSRLVPFLQFFNKLFLTTPNFYPHYIELLGKQEHFANGARSNGDFYLQYHALRLTIGNVPIWTENFDYTLQKKEEIFRQYIEPIWKQQIQKV